MRIFLFLLLENCQQTKPMVLFLVVNQHQPNQSSKKIAISWGVGGLHHPTFQPTFQPTPFPTFASPQETLQKLKALQGGGGSTAEEQKAQRMKAAAAAAVTWQRLGVVQGWGWGTGKERIWGTHVVWCFIRRYLKHPKNYNQY